MGSTPPEDANPERTGPRPQDGETSRDALTTHRLRLPDHVVSRAYASETIVLNLKTGTYHGLNVTGGRMLEVVNEEANLGAAARRLAEEFGQQVETVTSDLVTFCDDLLDRGLITVDRATSS